MVKLRRVPPSISGTRGAPPSPDRSTEAAAVPSLIPVEALLVGRFHLPQEPPGLGDTVEEDQVLGVVESMGLMNPVAAPADGRIAAIHVEEGQPVEYGQLLFEITP